MFIKLIKKGYWLIKACAANLIYGFPSRQLCLIGVTGTDGKTTTTTLIYHILKNAGKKVSYITSVGAVIGDREYDTGFHVTTPSPFFLQQKIKQAVLGGSKYLILETTSHAIDQFRTWGCSFKIVALTNISNEHLDYHKNYRSYAKTKCALVNSAPLAVVNLEASTYYRYKDLIKNKNLWTCGVKKEANFLYSELVKNGLKQKFVDFEKENVSLASGVAKLLGLETSQIARSLNSFVRVKGRFNYFVKGHRQFLIDFAHTPNAFTNLFNAIVDTLKYQRLIHVFGAAGQRDFSKRKVMGEISGNYADMIILTEEDYRTEKLSEIFKEIEKGIRKNQRFIFNDNYFFVENRQEAINLAVKLSGEKDLIVLTGKAHEQSLCRGKTEYPYDEFAAVDQALVNVKK